MKKERLGALWLTGVALGALLVLSAGFSVVACALVVAAIIGMTAWSRSVTPLAAFLISSGALVIAFIAIQFVAGASLDQTALWVSLAVVALGVGGAIAAWAKTHRTAAG